MKTTVKMSALTLILTATLALTAIPAAAQLCVGFTTDFNDFIDVPAVDLLPQAGWSATQPLVRGGVAYTGGSLLIGTECPGAYGDLAMCDFSSPTTGVPEAGTTLRRFGLDFWADQWINPFQFEVELSSGAVENFTATTSGGFVGYCAPIGETIVRVRMEGHDGVATAIYHGVDGPVATATTGWGTFKASYR